MTDEERQKLEDTHRMSKAIHKALMEKGLNGEPPLADRIYGVVVLVERSNWAVKWLFRGILGLAALTAALGTIKVGFFK